ncbi:coagulation factor XI-like [Micropterus salmoides]|uniref:coagulation factor XI-like n=1 Tax=Micropterus salmoides TaxID=27706 RepID=UPI0018EDD469|nr:coagulation factor XI-like [Micropterus salmoides]
MGTYLILVGLLSICSLSFSQECSRELVKNVDFPGAEVSTPYSPDAEHCQQLCTQHSSCQFFTFVQGDWTRNNRTFRCCLRSSASGQPNARTALQNVTSGFSLKPCNPDPQPCLSQVYQNVEFPGADYRSFFTADYKECQRACTQDPACRFFTFANGLFTPEKYRFKCQLKYSWAIPRTPDVETKAGVTSGFSHKTKFTQHFDTACEGRLFVNTAIPEHHLQKLSAASPQQCQTLCSAHPLCTYFTYVSTNLTCLLKNNRNEMVIKNKEGVTSGMPARFCQPDNNWIKVAHKDVDFPGSNIRFEPKDNADACQKACTNDKYCQFYSYVNDNFSDPALRRRCYLKRVITMPAPPKVAKLANVVSGFTKKNCHGQKQ